MRGRLFALGSLLRLSFVSEIYGTKCGASRFFLGGAKAEVNGLEDDFAVDSRNRAMVGVGGRAFFWSWCPLFLWVSKGSQRHQPFLGVP